jgi:hypothetical protein
VKPFVKMGVEFGIALSAKFEAPKPFASPGPREVEEEDFKDDLKKPDTGLLVALGLDFPIGSFSGFAQLSYSHGVGDILDPGGAVADAILKSRVLVLVVGLNLGQSSRP